MTSGKATNPASPQSKRPEIDDDLYLAARVHAEREQGAPQSNRKRPSRAGRAWLAVARSVV